MVQHATHVISSRLVALGFFACLILLQMRYLVGTGQTANDDRWGRAINRRLSHSRTRRPRALSQRRCDRELCWGCATAAAIREKALLPRQPHNPFWECSPAQGALDGGSQRSAMQSVAAAVLRTASFCGQARQSRGHRGHAQTARRSLECGDPSTTVRSAFNDIECDRRW
jgi:hypothetical protein